MSMLHEIGKPGSNHGEEKQFISFGAKAFYFAGIIVGLMAFLFGVGLILHGIRSSDSTIIFLGVCFSSATVIGIISIKRLGRFLKS